MGLKERRQRERDARREQILKAARDLLYKKGHGLTQLKKFETTLLKNDSHRDFYEYSVELYIEMLCADK